MHRTVLRSPAPAPRRWGALALAAAASLLAACADEGSAPSDGDIGVDEQRSICGATNDAQHVNAYNGNLGPSVAFVQARKTPVGAMEDTNADDSFKYCSGTLIANDLFLTAGHCVDSTTVGQFVSFNFELAAGGSSLLAQSHFRISQVVENGRSGLDYAILRLDGSPGSTFGVAPVRTADPATGAAITIIGHPEGEPKQIEAGTVASFSGSSIRYGNLDTLGGSSGSGILDDQGRIVGVHTNGGCFNGGGTNSGVRISRIRSASNVL
ncbi:MAG TPA: trypsin-like peptidase domain-containing protein [Polyangiaceae bacterium]|nr:trypsin-like peptidase domain-containing protein [Polyangiaceae bacterium]